MSLWCFLWAPCLEICFCRLVVLVKGSRTELIRKLVVKFRESCCLTPSLEVELGFFLVSNPYKARFHFIAHVPVHLILQKCSLDLLDYHGSVP